MCGIAGVYTTDGSAPADTTLEQLENALAHRGPDGRGRYIGHAGSGMAMVHTRLSIIDLETGDQPFHSEEENAGGVHIVANGEIYNYLELQDSLDGAVFTSRSDCEVPLHLYLRHGVDFTEYLRGMYAIAIYDARPNAQGRLVLARDPFGIKPLYYVETGKGFAFASQPQALVNSAIVAPVLNRCAINELLQLQFTCGSESAFAGIHRVLPGETIVVEKGRIIQRHKRQALPQKGFSQLSTTEALENLDKVLIDSVTLHQRSDVPYGMFLSGGVDSSALLALMCQLNDTPVQTFSAGFSDSAAFDERDHARRVAKVAGANFEAVEFSRDDFWQLLPRITAVMDDPVADYAILPTYKLAQCAAANGLKVILCGEGGDELFAGYGRYRKAMRSKLLGGKPMRSSGAFDGLNVLRENSPQWRNAISTAETAETINGRSTLQVCQALDCLDWLPHDLLGKLDRCLMAHGVEGRVPFLDIEVAKMAFMLPDKLKVQGNTGKWLLRKWLDGKMPEAMPFAKKRGFSVPVSEWITSKGKHLGELVARQEIVKETCLPGSVERLFVTTNAKAGKAAWNLLFFALWHKIHMEKTPPEGDVFSVLEI